jgi:hypothetical protein
VFWLGVSRDQPRGGWVKTRSRPPRRIRFLTSIREGLVWFVVMAHDHVQITVFFNVFGWPFTR